MSGQHEEAVTLRDGVLPVRPEDTHPFAERVQLQLLRQASTTQRASLALSLSATTLQLAHRAIREAHAGEDELDIAAQVVTHCYGPALGEQVREYLRARHTRASAP